THIYDGSPERAVNRGFTQGILDRKIPWLRQMGLAALTGAKPNRDDAAAFFRKALDEKYTQAHAAQKPAPAALDGAAEGLAALYRRNVYPNMNIDWGQYASNIGHGGPDPGNTRVQCFRCHSGNHQTADGRELTSKCESCHEVIA